MKRLRWLMAEAAAAGTARLLRPRRLPRNVRLHQSVALARSPDAGSARPARPGTEEAGPSRDSGEGVALAGNATRAMRSVSEAAKGEVVAGAPSARGGARSAGGRGRHHGRAVASLAHLRPSTSLAHLRPSTPST